MRLQLLWTFAIVVWLASAAWGWVVVSAVAMFNGLSNQPPAAWLFFLAPVIALCAALAGAAVRRKAVWLPATLLASPALQAIGLAWAEMEKTL